MTKRQIIDEILRLNATAEPGFLARFDEEELDRYRRHLGRTHKPRLTGNPERYDRYFRPIPAEQARQWTETAGHVAAAEAERPAPGPKEPYRYDPAPEPEMAPIDPGEPECAEPAPVAEPAPALFEASETPEPAGDPDAETIDLDPAEIEIDLPEPPRTPEPDPPGGVYEPVEQPDASRRPMRAEPEEAWLF